MKYLIKKSLTRKKNVRTQCVHNALQASAYQKKTLITINQFYHYLVQLNLEEQVNMLRTVTFIPYHSLWNHIRNIYLTVCINKQSLFQASYGPLVAKTRIKLNHR